VSNLPAGSFEPGSELPGSLADAVSAWSAQDPDPDTRGELASLLDQIAAGSSESLAELTDAFHGRLQFGTAGLRGAIGAGPNRMNRVVVGQAAAGLAAYLLDQGLAGGTVIIGHDARHKSDAFARDSAEIFAGAGFRALLVPVPTPTPVVAFGIGHFGCVAGVVVTASHNPPQDNGYKVYLGDGSQIVPPADGEIAGCIEEITHRDLSDVPRSDDYVELGDELVGAYLDRVTSLVPAGAARDLDWVYTPMHGVGGRVVAEAVARAGFTGAEVVAEQAEPDPDFPTVGFPNPEEPGAIDLALALARRTGADLVVANDPMRTAAPSPRRSTTPGGCCAGTSSERCSATTPCVAGSRAPTRARSCPARCWRRWPPPTGSRSRPRSRGSSGSVGSPGSPSATRRRSATAWTRRRCRTRTASRP
jgi:phosphomannomutase